MPHLIRHSLLNLPKLKEMKVTCFDEMIFCQMLSSTRCLQKIGIERRAGSPRDEVFFPFINQVLCQHLQLNYMQIMDNNNGGSSFEPILGIMMDYYSEILDTKDCIHFLSLRYGINKYRNYRRNN